MENAGKARLNGSSDQIRTGRADGAPGLSFIGRVANWSARHRWWVIGASLMVVVLAFFVLNTVESEILDDEGIEGEAAVGADLIEERFDVVPVPTEQLVFSNPSLDANDQAYRSTVEGLVQQLRALPEVESVTSYYDTNDPSMLSQNGSVLLAQVVIEGDADDAEDKIDAILDTVHAGAEGADGFEITIAGSASLLKQVDDIDKEDFTNMIVVTMVLALALMLLVFRSVVAATIPLIMALGAIFSALGVATLVSYVYPMPEFLAQVVLLMGMAVGVDYSLFIVSRYRNERKAGRPKLEAITVACNTTGRAVFYAGVTVLLSLAGLILTDMPVFISMAIGVIIVVSLALVASLTLLPAMLAVLGDNVNRLRLPIIGRESKENNGGGIWGTITDKVLARPGILATVTAAALIALAVPVLSLDLGFGTGSDNYHDAVEGKRALQLLEENFTGSLAAPAYVIVDASDVNSANVQASVARLVEAVERKDAFSPPFDIQVNPAGDLLYVEVPLVGGTDEEESENAVKILRKDIISSAFAGSDAQVYVSGGAASSLDTTDKMNSAAPYVLGFVLGLAFLLLLVMFRSIVIPVKAIALNLLSVGAAYGVMVMVFQWGWGNRHPGIGSHRGNRAVDTPVHVRHPLRPLHGLPHATAQPDKGCLRPGIQQRGVGIQGYQADRGADHQRGGHHGGHLRHLRPGAERVGAAVWTGTGGRGVDRRHRDPHGAAPRQHEAPWRPELVPAQLARVAAQGKLERGQRPRRGHLPAGSFGQRRLVLV